MDTQQNLLRIPRDFKFRVLIIGRANAGMTSILQRVCDTTESPEIYRWDSWGNRERVRFFVPISTLISKYSQVYLDPSIEVRRACACRWWLIVTTLLVQRGMSNIEDEIVFTNHNGYVFHDSRGLESGSEVELRIIQDFVRRRSQERRLKDRLHAIWFVPLSTCSCKFTKFAFPGTASRWTMIGHR